MYVASDGWTYYFKKEHNLVDRHIDKICVSKPQEEEDELKRIVEKFKIEQLLQIIAYSPEKVFFFTNMEYSYILFYNK